MKITRRQLQRLIQEELQQTLQEQDAAYQSAANLDLPPGSINLPRREPEQRPAAPQRPSAARIRANEPAPLGGGYTSAEAPASSWEGSGMSREEEHAVRTAPQRLSDEEMASLRWQDWEDRDFGMKGASIELGGGLGPRALSGARAARGARGASRFAGRESDIAAQLRRGNRFDDVTGQAISPRDLTWAQRAQSAMHGTSTRAQGPTTGPEIRNVFGSGDRYHTGGSNINTADYGARSLTMGDRVARTRRGFGGSTSPQDVAAADTARAVALGTGGLGAAGALGAAMSGDEDEPRQETLPESLIRDLTKQQIQKIIQEELYQILKEHEAEEEHMHSVPAVPGRQYGGFGPEFYDPATGGSDEVARKDWILRQPGGEDLYADYLATRAARSGEVEFDPEKEFGYPGEPEPGTFGASEGPPAGPQNIRESLVEAVLAKLIK